jgi:hypothetical protein
MNPYLLGGGVLALAVMGFLLKGAYERNGELEAKLETQAAETLEATSANTTNQETITELEARIAGMIEERRADTERREQVLVEREQELLRARARADRLEEERDNEIETNPDCADLTSLSLDMFCPNTASQLRQRSRSAGGNGDTDG